MSGTEPVRPPAPGRVRGGSPTFLALGLILFGLVVSTPLWASAGVAGFMTGLLVAVALAQVAGAMANAGVLLVGLYGLTGFGASALVVADDRLGLNPVVAVGAAALASAVLGILLVPLVLRLPPAVASLAVWVVAAAGASLATQVGPLVGGGRQVIEGVTALGSRDTFAASLAVVLGVGTLLAVHALRRSPSGLALRASADAPEAAAGLDLPLRRARWVTWMLTATVAGAAGAVAGFSEGAVSAGEAFSLSAWTLPALVAIGVGGMESVEGPLLGALLWALGAELTEGNELEFQIGAAAVALVVQGTFGPGGLWGRFVGERRAELFPTRRLFSRRERAGGRAATPRTGP